MYFKQGYFKVMINLCQLNLYHCVTTVKQLILALLPRDIYYWLIIQFHIWKGGCNGIVMVVQYICSRYGNLY